MLNADKYIGLSLDALQQEMISFTSNHKSLMDEEVMHQGTRLAASSTGSNSALATQAGKPYKFAPTPTVPDNKPMCLSVENIKFMATSGKCLCGCDHKLELLCGFLMKEGYLLGHDAHYKLVCGSQ